MRGLDNTHIAIYDSDNLYGFPEMPKCDKVLVRDWQTFKYAITTQGVFDSKKVMADAKKKTKIVYNWNETLRHEVIARVFFAKFDKKL